VSGQVLKEPKGPLKHTRRSGSGAVKVFLRRAFTISEMGPGGKGLIEDRQSVYDSTRDASPRRTNTLRALIITRAFLLWISRQ
jgi:hypothetical protein